MTRALPVSALVCLTACTVAFSPGYDPGLVEGLDEANVAALTLFSTMSQGAPQDSYTGQRQSYDEIIGRFDALRVRAGARDTPAVAPRMVSRFGLDGEVCADPDACINPTPQILATLLTGLRRMQGQHRSGGVPADQVAIYKSGYEVSITQALAVERAFER